MSAAVRRCHEAVHAMGAPRVNTTVRLGTRVDPDQTLADSMRSVELSRNGLPLVAAEG